MLRKILYHKVSILWLWYILFLLATGYYQRIKGIEQGFDLCQEQSEESAPQGERIPPVMNMRRGYNINGVLQKP